jgi:hypothetical protein
MLQAAAVAQLRGRLLAARAVPLRFYAKVLKGSSRLVGFGSSCLPTDLARTLYRI